MDKPIVAFLVATAAVLVADPASAQEVAPAGDRSAIQIGLRLGYGFPLGHTGRTATDASDDEVSATIKGQIPIGLDAGYLFNPSSYLGLSFQYGFGFIGSHGTLCDQLGVSCSTQVVRLGANFHYHLMPAESFDPWLGLGIGYEWLGYSASGVGGTASGSGSGFEFANLQVGGDFKLAPEFAAGPFVSISAGQYRTASTTLGTTTTSQDVTNKSFHEWVLFGVRGIYNIRL